MTSGDSRWRSGDSAQAFSHREFSCQLIFLASAAPDVSGFPRAGSEACDGWDAVQPNNCLSGVAQQHSETELCCSSPTTGMAAFLSEEHCKPKMQQKEAFP